MSAKVFSAATVGLEATLVEVEVDIGRSLPNVLMVGLPDAAVQEAKERVRAAIKNSGLKFPTTRVTVNLAPGDVKKEGPLYDLPVALAILIASEEIRAPKDFLEKTLFVGELALDGSVRAVDGVLSATMLARDIGFRYVVVPHENAAEAALVDGIGVLGARTLQEVVRHLIGEVVLATTEPTPGPDVAPILFGADLAHVNGQQLAKRALEIAAAGGHNVRFTGPPGSGKTLLARGLATILPAMTKEELLEVTRIYSVAGLLGNSPYVSARPFRSPHHTSSPVAIVGGGATPRPGEVSLAHRGVLFLDEFLEFPRQVLEVLRQPLEDGQVHIARASGAVLFPARFTLVTAENPCPCGYWNDRDRQCTCTSGQIVSYRRRVSGPLLDRIDLHVTVPRLPVAELQTTTGAETSVVIRLRVTAARQRQHDRYIKEKLATNAELSSAAVRAKLSLQPAAKTLLDTAVDKLHLSTRSYYRTIKVAQTIADLGADATIKADHVAEALQFRVSDEENRPMI